MEKVGICRTVCMHIGIPGFLFVKDAVCGDGIALLFGLT